MKRLLLAGSDSAHLWRYCKMISDGFDSIVVVTNRRPAELPDRVTDILLADFSPLHPAAFAAGIIKIRRKIRESLPDYIHVQQANTVATAVMLAAGKYNRPIVLTALGSDILVTPRRGYIYKAMVKYNLGKAAMATSDSVHMARTMIELCPGLKGRMVIANFGIDARREPDIAKENIIYSNRMHKKLYRIDRILHLFREFALADKNGWRLVVAGEGPESGALRKLAGDLGLSEKVDFVGFLDHKSNSYYYNRARIYISMPEHDATSISLLEAMACGCVPVVSDLPANMEWVVDGINGVVSSAWEKGAIDRAVGLDQELADAVNKRIITQRATMGPNREKFMQAYANSEARY